MNERAEERIVILGAGQGGFQAAASLREAGFTGPLTLVGDEPGLPYQRPPLSKAYMKGDAGIEQIELRPAAFYADHRIELIEARATGIDRATRHLMLEGGARLGYAHLILATGARNRPLPVPGRELSGVYYLRTRADADALKATLACARHVVVIGAGFIGLEFAAVARALGHEVTVIEAAARPLGRAVSPEMSAFFAQAHRDMGTTLLLGAGVVGLEGVDGRVTGVKTTDGVVHKADFVLVGIGVVPNVELAAEAGLEVANGIVVDDHLATRDPAISALGDAVAYPSRFAGGQDEPAMVRLESVQNAVDQARCLAARLTGKSAPFEAVPWFWSDQGDLKLQMVGLAGPTDSAVLRGDPATRRFSVFRFRDGVLTAIESVNRPADHMLGRRLLAGTPVLTPEQAGDESFELKSLLGR
ncbi:3-phenylpropionate/trans-cinnamate dioxygenase ferredoxin reductase subunit [Angulomicrobium tetraedrale]|uniref:3-phenylpropionate/trans-cinnamate dioxygenase ferredoxin reductase subunit n=1 Tax=Ancylobacter tetraedralis TaxID=217068 RepID=A0A839ZBQ5_9HYPH|nr:FAD-dependent oxidoreductase [Ancylobacter tetraedralis]MBB3772145.1 3-phenylpropionate/trans-cinnamate dioxygenase ferredoxin reductase subunit [Ancylobacter tetraedralis]